jgi:hypothetical protein
MILRTDNLNFEIWLAALCIAVMIIWEEGQPIAFAAIIIFLILNLSAALFERAERRRMPK